MSNRLKVIFTESVIEHLSDLLQEGHEYSDFISEADKEALERVLALEGKIQRKLKERE